MKESRSILRRESTRRRFKSGSMSSLYTSGKSSKGSYTETVKLCTQHPRSTKYYSVTQNEPFPFLHHQESPQRQCVLQAAILAGLCANESTLFRHFQSFVKVIVHETFTVAARRTDEADKHVKYGQHAVHLSQISHFVYYLPRDSDRQFFLRKIHSNEV